jgi:hypothetical protein
VNLAASRSGLHVSLSWSSPGAVSYRLSVVRDEGTTQTLVGKTTATSAVYDLERGHSYSFVVTATDAHGSTVASSPYAVSLPYSAVALDLRASVLSRTRGTIRLWSAFNPVSKSVERGARKLVLESFGGHAWHRFSVARTSRTGVAIWTMRLRRGSYRIRVRYAGADDLAPATSRTITIRVR